MIQDIFRNDEESRYEVTVDGALARIDFRMMSGALALMHTEVPDAIASRGVARELTEYAIQDARFRSLEILPFCPYVTAYIKRHPEYVELVSDRFKAKASLRRDPSSA